MWRPRRSPTRVWAATRGLGGRARVPRGDTVNGTTTTWKLGATRATWTMRLCHGRTHGPIAAAVYGQQSANQAQTSGQERRRDALWRSGTPTHSVKAC
jgi:hypothetical protein